MPLLAGCAAPGAAQPPAQVESPSKGGSIALRGQNSGLRAILENPADFSRLLLPDHALRRYQEDPARAAAAAVRRGGELLAWVFSRQSGKDEALAQLLAWLLIRYQRRGGSMVVAAPTLYPQAAVTKDRLRLRLEACGLADGRWSSGQTIGVGKAQVTFLSAGKDANARGQTASLLLVANEAQDIDPDRWDAVFDPMAASTNATTLYMGTVWDGTGLLARQMRYLEELEGRDGRRRLFRVPWGPVAEEVPAYGDRVRQRIDQFGPDHPFIRTEYDLIELEGDGGLFGQDRRDVMRGTHRRRRTPEKGKVYAITVDVAGAEEETRQAGHEWDPDAARDATIATVYEVERTRRALPTYRAVNRYAWTGANQVYLADVLTRITRELWGCAAMAIDATGLGAGLAAVMADRLEKGPRACTVYPFVFGQASKSQLGWDFVGLIDAGRYLEYADDGAQDTATFWRELERITYQVRPGPGKLMTWGHRPGEHDDFVIAAALCAALDEHDWRTRRARGADWLQADKEKGRRT